MSLCHCTLGKTYSTGILVLLLILHVLRLELVLIIRLQSPYMQVQLRIPIPILARLLVRSLIQSYIIEATKYLSVCVCDNDSTGIAMLCHCTTEQKRIYSNIGVLLQQHIPHRLQVKGRADHGPQNNVRVHCAFPCRTNRPLKPTTGPRGRLAGGSGEAGERLPAGGKREGGGTREWGRRRGRCFGLADVLGWLDLLG